MGAIVGGVYACGVDIEELARFTLDDFNIIEYLDSFSFRRELRLGNVFRSGRAFAHLTARTGLARGEKILELLERLTALKTFSETAIPFRCNALDLLSGKHVIFDSGSIASAVRASMSAPLFFEPYEYRGMLLVDGGVMDNMPVTVARTEGFRRVLAVDVNRFEACDEAAIKNTPRVLFRTLECALNRATSTAPAADLTLSINSGATPFSFFKKRDHIAIGERAVRENLRELETFFSARRTWARKPVLCAVSPQSAD
jgi:NTE family protein